MMAQSAPQTITDKDPRRIHVSQLQVGMTVLREREDGQLVTDCTLAKRFTNSASPRLAPALSFVTTAKQLVIWQRCGYVWVL
jgi:hypothetical protein